MKKIILFFLLTPFFTNAQCLVFDHSTGNTRTSEDCKLEFFNTNQIHFKFDSSYYAAKILKYDDTREIPTILLLGDPGENAYLSVDQKKEICTLDFGNGTSLNFFNPRDREIAKVQVSYHLLGYCFEQMDDFEENNEHIKRQKKKI